MITKYVTVGVFGTETRLVNVVNRRSSSIRVRVRVRDLGLAITRYGDTK